MAKEVELSIPPEYKDSPFFYNVVKNFEVVIKIVEASFSTDTGWAIVKVDGSEKEIERLFKFLEEKGVRVTVR